LLLSRSAVSDVKLYDTFKRIQHFASLTGVEDLLIVYLLNTPPTSSFVSAKELTKNTSDDSTPADAIAAYSKLQAEMINCTEMSYIPIRPISKLDDLSDTIMKHVSALKADPRKHETLSKSFELLKLCTANPPMAEQTAYLLSDLFADFRDLAAACSTVTYAPSSSSPSARAAAFQSGSVYGNSIDMSTPSSDSTAAGKLKTLRDLVGEQECQDVIDFWKEEWLVQ
jgi:hypothetical protein